MYQFEADIKDVTKALNDNILFSMVYDYKSGIYALYNSSFSDIWKEIISSGYLEKGTFTTSEDIVFCMFPEVNEKKENLEKIYNMVGYKAHGNEQPVFFVDVTITSSRNDGVLFTTKGIYRKNKGMIAYSPNMPVKIDTFYEEIFIKNTRILSYKGSREVFEDIVNLANIVYLLNCIRHDFEEEIYRDNPYKDVWKKDEQGNMSLDSKGFKRAIEEKRKISTDDNVNDAGVGSNTSSGMISGIAILILIIFLFKGCA